MNLQIFRDPVDRTVYLVNSEGERYNFNCLSYNVLYDSGLTGYLNASPRVVRRLHEDDTLQEIPIEYHKGLGYIHHGDYLKLNLRNGGTGEASIGNTLVAKE